MERIQEFSDNRIPNDSKAVYSLFAVVENDQMQRSHIAVHPVNIDGVSEIFAMETHLPLAVIGLWEADIEGNLSVKLIIECYRLMLFTHIT